MDGQYTNPNTGKIWNFPREARKYIHLVQLINRTQGSAEPCWHGHFGCAIWDGGPCENEVAVYYGVDDEEV